MVIVQLVNLACAAVIAAVRLAIAVTIAACVAIIFA